MLEKEKKMMQSYLHHLQNKPLFKIIKTYFYVILISCPCFLMFIIPLLIGVRINNTHVSPYIFFSCIGFFSTIPICWLSCSVAWEKIKIYTEELQDQSILEMVGIDKIEV